MSIEQYLSRHANAAPVAIDGQYDASIVVPFYDETCASAERLLNQIPNSILTVAVVNAPSNANAASLQNTRKLNQHLIALGKPGLLVLDQVSTAEQLLPHKHGVGLARKIGTDTALKGWHAGQLRSAWIFQTDADALLPTGYFAAIEAQTPPGAAIFPYRHTSESRTWQQAADLYDLHMNYYIAGLAHAGSHYAYPTLGSTLAVHAESYALVRGYPKRNAGEDFYLLNKLAKMAQITRLATPELTLQARPSERVPFGTGPALRRIHAELVGDPTGHSYCSYAAHSFELLAEGIAFMDAFADDNAHKAPQIPAALLTRLGFDSVGHKMTRQFPHATSRRRALREWFDAFRTLRFIHEARRNHPDAPLLSTLSKRPFADAKLHAQFARYQTNYL